MNYFFWQKGLENAYFGICTIDIPKQLNPLVCLFYDDYNAG